MTALAPGAGHEGVGGLVFAPLDDHSGALVILDERRRLFAGLSRDGEYWHVVAPLLVDQLTRDGDVVRPAGTLSCRCKGALARGTCYRTAEAEAFEAGEREHIAWLPSEAEARHERLLYDAPVGAGESVEASRG